MSKTKKKNQANGTYPFEFITPATTDSFLLSVVARNQTYTIYILESPKTTLTKGIRELDLDDIQST